MEARKSSNVKKSNGPESAYFNKLLGRHIQVMLLGDPSPSREGILSWVDRYTICLTSNGADILIYKHAIFSVCATDRGQLNDASEATVQ